MVVLDEKILRPTPLHGIFRRARESAGVVGPGIGFQEADLGPALALGRSRDGLSTKHNWLGDFWVALGFEHLFALAFIIPCVVFLV
jgi:hypothetical protein